MVAPLDEANNDFESVADDTERFVVKKPAFVEFVVVYKYFVSSVRMAKFVLGVHVFHIVLVVASFHIVAEPDIEAFDLADLVVADDIAVVKHCLVASHTALHLCKLFFSNID